MRPPLGAGENIGRLLSLAQANRASMRPPLGAGENLGLGRKVRRCNVASMRPPLGAGENCTEREASDLFEELQ